MIRSPARPFRNARIHGANCTIAVEPTRPIEGLIRDIETNEPIPARS